MKQQVIREIARYLEAPEYQVAHWDDRLVEYFVDNRHQFELFCSGCQVNSYHAWLDGVRVTKRALE